MVSITRAAWIVWPGALLLACSPADQLVAPRHGDTQHAAPSAAVAVGADRAATNAANRRAFLAAAKQTVKGNRYGRAVITRDGFGKSRVGSLHDVIRDHEQGFAAASGSGASMDLIPINDTDADADAGRLITRAVSVVVGGSNGTAGALVTWNSFTVYAATHTMIISSSRRPSLTLVDSWNDPFRSGGRGPDPYNYPFEMFSEWRLSGYDQCEALTATTNHEVKSWFYRDDSAGSQSAWKPECEKRQEPVAPGGGSAGPHSIDAIGVPETQTDTWHCWLNQERWFEGGAWGPWVTVSMECGY